ncbi:MAG: superoxide dismutase family protein [Nocardioidaceae bacterium]|nr:superoxide dismutase family protein [Nocardioidaceae bacterium]
MRHWVIKRHLPVVPVITFVSAIGLFVASPAIAGADRVRAEGELVRYDTAAVPEGARARVQAVYTAAGDSIVTLHVWGMAANTEYGAHAHTNACGTTGASAGPHFQNEPDPVQPSTDPAYANPTNEIWLDLVTDADGTGVAQTKVPWQFSPQRRANSVIIHVEHTHTGPTDSGVAGARLACLTVGF